jgi:hypothetical protein
MAGNGGCLHGRQRQRQAARLGAADLLPGAPQDHGADRRKELAYGYFSQTLLPDYIEEHGVAWRVVYDARGHFEEPHTNRRIGCGTLEVRSIWRACNNRRSLRPNLMVRQSM